MYSICVAKAKDVREQKNKCWNQYVPACKIEEMG